MDNDLKNNNVVFEDGVNDEVDVDTDADGASYEMDEEIGDNTPLDDAIDLGSSDDRSERSVFLDNIRMEIHDEGAETNCKQNFLFAAAAGRISSVLRLEPSFSKYLPGLLSDTKRLQKIINSAQPEDLETWIEFHNSHSPIGFLTTFWLPPRSTNPIFMMRKFQYDVENSSQYIVSWFGDDMKAELPLVKLMYVNYVQRGKVMPNTPIHPDTKKSALAMSALLMAALAYKIDNSLIPENVAVYEELGALLPDAGAKEV